MKRISFYILILLTTILVSCNNRGKQVKEITAGAAEMDSLLRISQVMTPEQREKSDELIEKYKGFAEKYPDDTLSPAYLFKAAFLAGAMPDYKMQIGIFDMIAETYPKSEYAAQAIALAAKSCTDYLQDPGRAKEYLVKLQKEYPESPYAVNIDLQIEYVGDDDGLFQATMRRKAEQDSINAVKQSTGQ